MIHRFLNSHFCLFLLVFMFDPRTGILVSTLLRSIKDSAAFVFMMMLLLLGFACASNIWYGSFYSEFATWDVATRTTLNVLLGEWDMSTLNDGSVGSLQVYHDSP